METMFLHWEPGAFKSYKPTDQEMEAVLRDFLPIEVVKGRTYRLNDVLRKCKSLNFDIAVVFEKITASIESERALITTALGKELADKKIDLAYKHIQDSASCIYGNEAVDEYLTMLGAVDPQKGHKIADLCNKAIKGKFDSNKFSWKEKNILVLVEYLKNKKKDRYEIWDSLTFLAHEYGTLPNYLLKRKEQISLAMETAFPGN